MKKAFITGVNGQDGSYLSELLLDKGYTVTGMVRRSSTNNLWRIQHLLDHPNFALAYGDLLDSGSLRRLITAVQPDEIYNLAAQSHVKISFDIPEYTLSASGTSVVRILDILREYRESKEVKFYQAGSSEMFGSTPPTNRIVYIQSKITIRMRKSHGPQCSRKLSGCLWYIRC